MSTEFLLKDEFEEKKDGQSNDGESYFLFLDPGFNIISFNNAFGRIIKSPGGENPSSSLLQCDSLQKHWFRYLFDHAISGKSIMQEILITDDNDEIHWIRFDVSPSFNLNNEMAGVTFIGKNVDREKTQQEKIDMQKLLLQEIASTYSHELRHPLTNILAVISLIKHDNMHMSDFYFECLETATKQMDDVIKTVALQLYNAA